MRLTEQQIRQGYWYYRPDLKHPPRRIVFRPDQYRGESRLCVCPHAPTAHQTRRLVKVWCHKLPMLKAVTHLWLAGRNQELFDAACEMPRLQALSVGGARIKSIRALTIARHLKALHIGASPSIQDVERFAELKQLVVLSVENIRRLSDLSPIGELTNLQALDVTGSMWTDQVVDSLKPLARLEKLRYLCLVSLRARDRTLRPLAALKSLVTLYAAWWWPASEFHMLRQALPKLKYGNPLDEKSIAESAKKG